MSLALTSAKLLSRVIRANVSNGLSGKNIISRLPTGAITSVKPRIISGLSRLKSEPGELGLFERIYNPIKAFVGFAIGAIKAIKFSATKVWGWLVNTVNAIKAFNWNATDKQLQDSLKSRNVALAGIWGGVLGQGAGWAAGIGIGYGISFFCPVIGGAALARTVASKATLEAVEEMAPTFLNAVKQTAVTFTQNKLINGYMQFRKLIKSAPKPLLTKIFGEKDAEFIKNKWGGEGGPDMSFNAHMDERVDSIKSEELKEFVEEFLDEAWDSFTESGFVIAHEIDEAYAQHRNAQKEILGPGRTIEIQPDTQADEKLKMIEVPQKLAVPFIQATLNTQRLLYNRDVGEIIGQPYGDWLKARPQLRQLTIVFRSRERPPWRHTNGKRCREASYTIPDIKKGVTWEEIKRAASPFTWGKFRATANLDNQRQMAVYGTSEAEAKKKLLQLAQLSDAKIMTISIAEEELRPAKMKKDATPMFPAFGTLLARKNSLDQKGRTTLDSKTYDEEVIRFALWTAKEPKGLILPR
jgi:hypothetical protein